MSKSLNKIKVFLSFSLLASFSCDFRSKNATVETINDDTCVITWQNADGTILDQEIYEKGKLPEYKKEEPVNNDKSNNAYQFIGWEPQIREVDENMTYTAVYETIKAAFVYRLDSEGDFYHLIKYTPEVKQSTITIPEMYQGKPVSVIDNYALRGCSWVTTINIPSTVTAINDYAFQNTGISSITIPNSVKSLGTNVFRDCKNLQSVTLPSGITKIPERFFYNCDNLVEFSFPSSITSIENKAFYNCNNLRTINISSNIETIKNKAFNQCEKLSIVNISSSSRLSELEEYAFSETGIERISLPETLETVSSYCFSQCTELTSFSIDPSNSNHITIKNSAFEGCKKLSNYSAPTLKTTYEDAAFKDCTSLTSFTLGNNTTTIPESLFQNCSSLTNLSLTNPDNLVSIKKKALSNTALSSFDIPKSVSLIEDEAFSNCDNLKRVIFPGGYLSLSSSAFSNCRSLSSFCIFNNNPLNDEPLTINAASLASYNPGIDTSAVTNISIPNSTYSISSDIFASYSNLSYNEFAEGSDTGYKGYYLGNSSNPYLALVKMEILTSNATVKIHPSCELFADRAFSSCNKDFNIDIETQLKNFGEYTFSNSKLKNISFASNVSLPQLPRGLFDQCSNLQSVSLPHDLSSIPGVPFYECPELQTINLPESNPTYKVINNSLLVDPNESTIICGVKNCQLNNLAGSLTGIDTIGSYAFYKRYTNTTLNVPSCIQKIQSNAYNGSSITTTVFGCDGPANLTTLSSTAFANLPTNTSRTIKFNGPLSNWLGLTLTGFSSVPFSQDQTTSLYLSDNSNGEFSQLTGILDLTNIQSFEKIPDYAFVSVKGITACYVNSSTLKEIGNYSFYNCTNLANFGFKKDSTNINALEKIGSSAFENCTSLQIRSYEVDNTSNNITTYNNLTRINENAFKNCTSLNTKFHFKALRNLHSTAFEGASSIGSTSIILDLNTSVTLGSSTFSFANAESLTGIIIIFSQYTHLTINSSAFNHSVKLYCAYEPMPPNNKISDYSITRNDTNSVLYYQYYHELDPADINNTSYKWFTFTSSKYEVAEGKPQAPSNN